MLFGILFKYFPNNANKKKKKQIKTNTKSFPLPTVGAEWIELTKQGQDNKTCVKIHYIDTTWAFRSREVFLRSATDIQYTTIFYYQ